MRQLDVLVRNFSNLKQIESVFRRERERGREQFIKNHHFSTKQACLRPWAKSSLFRLMLKIFFTHFFICCLPSFCCFSNDLSFVHFQFVSPLGCFRFRFFLAFSPFFSVSSLLSSSCSSLLS